MRGSVSEMSLGVSWRKHPWQVVGAHFNESGARDNKATAAEGNSVASASAYNRSEFISYL